MQRKLSQIRAMILVAALELERLESMTLAQAKKKIKKPPHVELRLIKGGKPG